MSRRSRLTWPAALGALVLAACVSEPPSVPPPPAPTPEPPAPPPPPDLCGAAEAQKYVGRPRTEIPVPVNPALQRVACATCAVTMDYNPRRLTFLFDAATGIVKSAKCG